MKTIDQMIDDAATSEHKYKQKGSGDFSCYESMMKYEINYEREEAFINGAKFMVKHYQSEIEKRSAFALQVATEKLDLAVKYGDQNDELIKLKKANQILKEALRVVVDSPENASDSYGAFKISIRAARQALKEVEEL